MGIILTATSQFYFGGGSIACIIKLLYFVAIKYQYVRIKIIPFNFMDFKIIITIMERDLQVHHLILQHEWSFKLDKFK